MLKLQIELSYQESRNTKAAADYVNFNNLEWLNMHFKKTIQVTL